jgi:hypothetical protein
MSMTAVRGFSRLKWQEEAFEIEAELNRLAAGLTETQFHAPARDGGWSIGYCIEHLLATGHDYIVLWDCLIAAQSKLPALQGPVVFAYPYNWLQRRLLHLVENSGWGIRLRSPASIVPCVRRSLPKTMEAFRILHRDFAIRLSQCRALDPRRTCIRLPYASWIRLSLGFSFDLVLAHERRHLRQAWRVRHQLIRPEQALESKV